MVCFAVPNKFRLSSATRSPHISSTYKLKHLYYRKNRWNIDFEGIDETSSGKTETNWIDETAPFVWYRPLIKERTNKWNNSCVSTTSNNCRKSIDIRIIVCIIWRVLTICCNNTPIKLVPITMTKPTIRQLVYTATKTRLILQLTLDQRLRLNLGLAYRLRVLSRPTREGFAFRPFIVPKSCAKCCLANLNPKRSLKP